MNFPVLVYKKAENRAYIYYSENELKTTNEELYFKEKIFSDIEIVDSVGNLFSIVSTKKVGWATAFWGYSLTRKGRLIRIDFEVKKIKHFTVGDFKTFVLELGSKSHALWAEVEEKVRTSNSYIEIINLLR